MRSLKITDLLRNAPLVVFTSGVLLSMEGFGWSYLARTNDALHASLMACVVSGTGIVGLIASYVTAERRQDPRYRGKSEWAWLFAIAMMVPGIMLAADSIAFPTQVSDAHSYLASEEHTEDLRSAAVAQSEREHSDAAENLAKGTVPGHALIDGTFFAALVAATFIYMANMFAATALWRAKPETTTERKRREARIRRQAKRPKDIRKDLKIA